MFSLCAAMREDVTNRRQNILSRLFCMDAIAASFYYVHISLKFDINCTDMQ